MPSCNTTVQLPVKNRAGMQKTGLKADFISEKPRMHVVVRHSCRIKHITRLIGTKVSSQAEIAWVCEFESFLCSNLVGLRFLSARGIKCIACIGCRSGVSAHIRYMQALAGDKAGIEQFSRLSKFAGKCEMRNN